MIHELKCEQQYFEAVASGKKTFEVRKNDRLFEAGDFLALNELVITEEGYTEYTGRCCLVEIAYVLDDPAGRFLAPGYVCMAIRPCFIGMRSEDMKRNMARDLYEVPIYNIKEENQNA